MSVAGLCVEVLEIVQALWSNVFADILVNESALTPAGFRF